MEPGKAAYQVTFLTVALTTLAMTNIAGDAARWNWTHAFVTRRMHRSC